MSKYDNASYEMSEAGEKMKTGHCKYCKKYKKEECEYIKTGEDDCKNFVHYRRRG